MASVKRRGNAWQATYRGPDGRERTKTFRLRVEADHWVTDQVAMMNRGEWLDPRAGRTTFGEYAKRWQAIQVHRPSTAAGVAANLRLHMLPTFETRSLGSILPSDLQAWVRDRSEVLRPSSLRIVYKQLVAVLRAAAADRLITSVPTNGVRLPRIEPAKIDPLPTEVVDRLIDAVPERYRALVVLAAGTGLRQGECLGLTVDRVNFLRRQLTVDRQLIIPPGSGTPILGPPKTESSYRTVPLPQVVTDALASHLATFPPGPDAFVFTTPKGDPISRGRFSEMWRPATARAGAPVGTGFHALRHFYASLLIRHGENVKTVQARLGHKTAAETLNTYSHLWPDSEDRTRTAIDDVLGVTRTARGHDAAVES